MSTSTTASTRLSIREQGRQLRAARKAAAGSKEKAQRQPITIKSVVRGAVKTAMATKEVLQDLPSATLDTAYGISSVAKEKFQAVKAECSDVWNEGLDEVNKDLNTSKGQ